MSYDASTGSPSPVRIRKLRTADRPVYRLHDAGPAALSDGELLAILIQATTLDYAQQLLVQFDGWRGLLQATSAELQRTLGIGPHRAAQIRAALEVGRRLVLASVGERFRIRSPTDAATVLMAEMGHLDQEELRTVLLTTKNEVQVIHTVYVGSLNSAIIRVGEVFKEAVRRNSAALIVAHNHPSSDWSFADLRAIGWGGMIWGRSEAGEGGHDARSRRHTTSGGRVAGAVRGLLSQ